MTAQSDVLGARARTQAPSTPLASAVAWSDKRAVEGGSHAVVQQHCDATVQVVDGRGRTEIPNLG
jgi:predicted amidohydrolase YtcJ